MKTSLRNVKNEIRILGLDQCNQNATVGAVVRGGLYLDGIVVFSKRLTSHELAKSITQTKYFPELKVIMIHNIHNDLGLARIERITRLPTIRISLSNSEHHGKRVWKENDFGSLVETRIDSLSLRKLLTLTRISGRLPEPVRIAHLIAKLHIFGRLSQDKG